MNLFFDTSAFVKYLVDEKGTEEIRELIEDSSNELYGLSLIRLETYSALFRRAKNNEIPHEKLVEMCRIIDEVLEYWVIDSVTDDVMREAEALIRKFGLGPGLRTLDALHLASFSLNAEPDWCFVCADSRLCDIVKTLGYKTINPI